MSYFAKVEDGVVTEVLAVEQEQIDTGMWGNPSLWIQTSFNTKGGVHYGQNGKPDGGIALRGNYAGIGHIYDKANDVFYPPRPVDRNQILCSSWTISAPNWTWTPPIPYPDDKNFYDWDETTTNWVEVK